MLTVHKPLRCKARKNFYATARANHLGGYRHWHNPLDSRLENTTCRVTCFYSCAWLAPWLRPQKKPAQTTLMTWRTAWGQAWVNVCARMCPDRKSTRLNSSH